MTRSESKRRSSSEAVRGRPRRLFGLGVSLFVGALILMLVALLLPSSPSARTATAAAPDHTASASAGTRAPAHQAAPAPTGTQPGSTTSSPAPGTQPTAPAQPYTPVTPTQPNKTVVSAPAPLKTATPATVQVKIGHGDTLWALARHYGTTVAALQSVNGLGTSTLIYAGRYLRVPSGTGAAPAAGTVAAPIAPASGGAATAVAYAKAQIGKPYLWGGAGPYAFDCSGLVMRAWRAGGVALPRTTYEQANAGRRISRSALAAGDLVFTEGFGHVQLYIGAGRVIEAPYTGATVRYASLPPAGRVDAYVRVAPADKTGDSGTAAAATTAQPASTTTGKGAATGTGIGTGKGTGTGTAAGIECPMRTATSTSMCPPAPPTATVPGHTTPGFKGIYAFSSGNSAALATDPDVAGTSLVYYWAQLEPQQGVYRWDLVDKDIAPWAAAGKKVILRVAAAGWASWDKTANSAHGTPAWVYAQGVKSVTEKDGAVLPQYWNPAFQSDLATFVHAFAARYDGNPHVALIDAAVGIGGETKPDSEKNPNLTALWHTVGYSDPLWWATVAQTISLYTSSFHTTPVAVMPDKTFLDGAPGYNEAKTVAFAVAHGAWLQDNGLIPGRTLPAPWATTPIVSEQRGPTSQTGDSLAADLHAAVTDHAALILVFASDLTNPANRSVIHQYAAQNGPGTTAHTPATKPQQAGPGHPASTPRPSATPVRRTR